MLRVMCKYFTHKNANNVNGRVHQMWSPPHLAHSTRAHTFMFTLQNHLPLHSNKVSSKLSSSQIHRIYAIHAHERNKRQKPIDRNCGISIGARPFRRVYGLLELNAFQRMAKKRLIFFQANRVKRSQLISHVWVYMVCLGTMSMPYTWHQWCLHPIAIIASVGRWEDTGDDAEYRAYRKIYDGRHSNIGLP